MKLYEIWTRGSGDGLKDTSDLEPFVQWTGNIRRHHGEQSCEIILNVDLWFRRKFRLKVFLIWSFSSPFVRLSVTICAILEEGIKRNNSRNIRNPYLEFCAGCKTSTIGLFELFIVIICWIFCAYTQILSRDVEDFCVHAQKFLTMISDNKVFQH